ncbi:hypothetical protein KIL84_007117 [Mauremys mutica]|uniref:Uncharacterized protein n=1 Tax=Mauremys mutica TaxID=74926 RepID=A0A9D3X0I3_9SAUR|nr:hypothetical protein KIL84_007117 [Mauremys mutica]
MTASALMSKPLKQSRLVTHNTKPSLALCREGSTEMDVESFHLRQTQCLSTNQTWSQVCLQYKENTILRSEALPTKLLRTGQRLPGPCPKGTGCFISQTSFKLLLYRRIIESSNGTDWLGHISSIPTPAGVPYTTPLIPVLFYLI